MNEGEEAWVLGHSSFHGQNNIHPVGLTLLIVFGIAILVLQRRHAMLAMLACASFIAVGQRFVVFTLDFNFIKIMVLFGWARLIMRQELQGFRWKTLDYCFVAWAAASTIAYSIMHGPSGFVWKLGTLLESFGAYFLARALIRDLSDVRSLVNGIAIISIPIAWVFLIESNTQRNLFAIFGGVPEITAIREGKIRCQGAYAHPILAGCFWAALFPLIASQIFNRGLGRILAILGVSASLTIVMCSASSTPMLGVLAGVVGFAMLPLRRSLRPIRWAIVATLICLHLMMKAPVWFLIGRVDFVGGSTGWHRANLIDQAINHFHEWVLFGAFDITHWGVFDNDVCNQYVLEAVRGGGLTLALFISILVAAFGNVGRLWRLTTPFTNDMLLAWAIGVSLFAHIINFIGVSYFGQIDILWYIGLALTAVTAAPCQIPLRTAYTTIPQEALPAVRDPGFLSEVSYR